MFKRQNKLLSEVWKLFSQITTDIPALMPWVMLPRLAREIHKKTYCTTGFLCYTIHFVS